MRDNEEIYRAVPPFTVIYISMEVISHKALAPGLMAQ